jgi:hypothetical protein
VTRLDALSQPSKFLVWFGKAGVGEDLPARDTRDVLDELRREFSLI